MPAITLDDLDSPIISDAQDSFEGGMNNNAVPLQLDKNQCATLEDAIVSVAGQAETRRGTAYVGSTGVVGSGSLIRGLGYYQTPSDSYPVAISDTLVKNLSGVSWIDLNAGRTFTNGSSPVIFANGNGYLYVTDGVGNIRRWSGSSWLAGDVTSDSAPTGISLMVWHTNRLIVGGQTSAPDALYFSGILDDTTWGSLLGGFQIQPGAGDGMPITAIVPWQNFNLAVFKQNSVWVVGCDPGLNVSDMPVEMIHPRIGCVATRSAVQVGSDVFFLSNDGVRSLEQTIAVASRYNVGLPLSWPVQATINRINPAARTSAAAVFWKGKYIIALPLDSSSTNNYILVYDTVTSCWSGGWTNLPVGCFSVRLDSGIEKLMMGLSNSNKVIEYLDYVLDADTTNTTYTDYNGNPVLINLITRGMIFGDLYSNKKGIIARVAMNKSNGQITIRGIFDESASTASATIDCGSTSTVILPVTLPCTFPRTGLQPASLDLMRYNEFKQIQFQVVAATVGRKEIRQITVEAFPAPMDFKGSIDASQQGI